MPYVAIQSSRHFCAIIPGAISNELCPEGTTSLYGAIVIFRIVLARYSNVAGIASSLARIAESPILKVSIGGHHPTISAYEDSTSKSNKAL